MDPLRSGLIRMSKPHRGSHVRLRYENEDAGKIRNVAVPLYDETVIGTLRSIANQCGGEDFQA